MDPYKVLGISPAASEDEIKAAYRKLAAQFVSDPAKMNEINSAYDQIMNERRLGTQGGPGASSYDFSLIRRYIAQNQYGEADRLLEATDPALRTAEWHFLKGSVCYAQGYLDRAYQCFSTASAMEPGNAEYRAALQRMDMQRNAGPQQRPGGYRTAPAGAGGCSACDMCTGLMCADCCCECMGGDLIRCC